MVSYDLNSMGDDQFEEMVQSLLKKVIGNGTITFGKGPDGGREAIFTGKGNYPSEIDPWEGKWIFQVKFHDIRQLGPEKARREVIADLKSELAKIIRLHNGCDNYILITNVKLSGLKSIGTHDKIEEIIPAYSDSIRNIHVWGYDEICRYLDNNADVSTNYLHLITPGPLIGQLIANLPKKDNLTEIISLYANTSFNRDRFAQLDQAGEVGEHQIYLPKVFVDLDVEFLEGDADVESEIGGIIVSATEKLMSNRGGMHSIIIGGPGQGKSTLCQFIAQIHRAYLLKRHEDTNLRDTKYMPSPIRIPFRIILKDYAQWIADQEQIKTFEDYLSDIIEDSTSRRISNTELHQLLTENPSLLILDGIDEVSDSVLLNRTIESIREFISRAENVLGSNLQILATSRPTGYSNQFANFNKFEIVDFNLLKIWEYVDKWIVAKGLIKSKSDSLRSILRECLRDSHFRSLMNTPLQVTIFILIILNGGIPPQQREELFNEYLEIVYKREASKASHIIRTEKLLLLGLHQYIGYILHRKAATSSETESKMNIDEFRNHVSIYLKVHDQYLTDKELHDRTKQVIDEARERLVLLVELEPRYFGFELRSLQEFFAAAYLVDSRKDDSQLIHRFRTIAHSSHWRNVALFFAGRIGRLHSETAANILEICREIDRKRPGIFTRQGSILAGELAVDRAFGFSFKEELQRSAMEIALNAHNYFATYRRNDIVQVMGHLQEGDIDKHLLPIISTTPSSDSIRLTLLPTVLSKFERYKEIVSQLRNSYEKGEIDSNNFLEKVIMFKIPTNFLFSEKDIFSSLKEDYLARTLYPLIRTNVEYLLEIITLLPDYHSLGDSIFERVMEKGMVHLRTLSPKFLSSLASINISEQSRNYQIITASYFSMLSYRLRSLMDAFRSISDIEWYEYIVEIIQIENLAIELRAVLFLILAKLARLNYVNNIYIKKLALEKDFLHQMLKGNEKDEYKIEKILHYMRFPSLETTQSLKKSKPSKIRLNRKLSKNIQIYCWILDTLDLNRTRKIINFVLNSKIDSRSIALFKDQERKTHYDTWTRQNKLNSKFVTAVLNTVCNMLSPNADVLDDWKPYNILKGLTSFNWTLDNEKRSLSEAISKIVNRINRISPNHRNGLILLLISRLAQLNHDEKNIYKLFQLLTLDSYFLERTTSFLVDKKAIKWLLKISSNFDESGLRGFLKWYYQYYFSKRTRLRDKEEINLRFNISKIKDLFIKLDGFSSSGALYIISQNNSIKIDELKYFIEVSKKKVYPHLDPWSEIIIKLAKKMNKEELIEYLEGILSDTEYPMMVRNAALIHYEQITADTGTEIMQRENDLGLPFQS
jgi:hypothetical protein